jgi:hypothetical protein
VSQGTEKPAYIIPPRYWDWLGTQQILVIILWLTTVGVGFYLLGHGRGWWVDQTSLPKERRRPHPTDGHVQIDFGGQWIMGRMLMRGYGRELYHRQRQWEVVWAGFPVHNETRMQQLETIVPRTRRLIARPDEEIHHDAEWLMIWVMGHDPTEWQTVGGATVAPLATIPVTNPWYSLALQHAAVVTVTPAIMEKVNEPAIGGPLYPPIHALLYAPLATDDNPRRSFEIVQLLATLFIPLAGLGVKILTHGRIWWSVATLVLFLYPGTRGGIDLAQNPTLSVSIVIWGWALATRGYQIAGGMVWGLLAYKPVWALALFLIPLLMRRWRFCLAMVLTGAGLAIATLPFVGLQTWFDWLKVGQQASELYNVNKNWIHLSRDLQGIPRRILHNFELPEDQRDTLLAKGLAWGIWGIVFATTVSVYLLWGNQKRLTGYGAAFLVFGAFLTCYRFMYYDVLISSLGFVVLFAEPTRFLRTRIFTFSSELHSPFHPTPLNPKVGNSLGSRLLGYVSSFPLTILMLLLLFENSLNGMQLEGTFGIAYYAQTLTAPDGSTRGVTPHFVADTGSNYPWETFLILALWAWCGWRLIRGDDRQPD